MNYKKVVKNKHSRKPRWMPHFFWYLLRALRSLFFHIYGYLKQTLAEKAAAVVLKIIVVLYKIYFGQRPHGHDIVVLPPSSRGSLGDDAMLVAVRENIVIPSGLQPVIFCYNSSDKYLDIFPNAYLIRLPTFASVVRSVMQAIAIGVALWNCRLFAAVGADVMDGAYSLVGSRKRLRIIEAAGNMAELATVVGFSVEGRVPTELRKMFINIAKHVILCLRDPLSFRRFTKTIASKNVKLTADVTFLLEPERELLGNADLALRWITDSIAARKPHIAVNLNKMIPQSTAIVDLTIEKYCDAHVEMINAVFRTYTEADVIFIPHDYRKPHADNELHRMVYEKLEPEHKMRCFLIELGLEAAEARALISRVDFLITGRMHLGIAALSVGTPCLICEYRGKVEGLAELMGMKELVFNATIFKYQGRFSELALLSIKQRRDWKKRIDKVLPMIQKMAMNNFEAARYALR